MDTIIRSIDIKKIDVNVIEEASRLLKQGGLVAFPTETVYGLGADGLNPQASSKIYVAKGRPSDNPLILHIATEEQLYRVVENVSDIARKLIDSFWPGPLTIIFNKSDIVPYETTGGLDTVAVRMPEHPIAIEVIRQSDVCVAAPSANVSGRPSPTEAKHVIEDLASKIDMIIDGGKVGIGIESTIVDVTVTPPMILRPGYISKEMLEEVVGEVQVDSAIIEPLSQELKPKAPGMKYKHYAPKGSLTIYEGKQEDVVGHINQLAKEKEQQGYKVGVIATDETYDLYHAGQVVSIGNRKDERTIAQNLYGVLRSFDENGIEYIFCEAFNTEQLGVAIMNRLSKAAGYKIKNV